MNKKMMLGGSALSVLGIVGSIGNLLWLVALFLGIVLVINAPGEEEMDESIAIH